MRFLLPMTLVLASCAIKDPFGGLPPGACSTDADCVVATCPNACNQGAPHCTYPLVHARADVEQACPCFGKPAEGACAAPAGDTCGPQPGCAEPDDVNQLRARCLDGACAARLADGGVP